VGQYLRSHLGDRLDRISFRASGVNRGDEVLNRLEIILFVASLIAVVIFACVGIRRWVWLDEGNSVLIALRGPHGIVRSLVVENNLPFYYFLLWIWTSLFGISEIAVRIPSVFFYLLTGGLVYLLALRVCRSRLAGMYAFLFFACSLQAIHQAQKIRMYSLLGCLSALSVLLWFLLFQGRRNSGHLYFLYTVVNTIGFLTHVYFFFVIAAEICACVAWLEWKQVRRMACSILISASVFGLLWGRIFWTQFHSPAGNWTPRLGYKLFRGFLYEVYGPWGTKVVVIGLALMLWGGRRRLVSGSFLRTSLASLSTIVVISYLLPLAISLYRPIYFPDRYTIAELPALAVLLGAATYSLLPRSVSVWLLLSLMAISLSTHILERAENPELTSSQGPLSGDRVVSSWLLKRLKPGDAVVFAGLSRASMDYYFLRSGANGRFFEISYPQSIDDHLGWFPDYSSPGRREIFHSDALALVHRLRRLPGQGQRIWLLSDDKDDSNVMKEELDRTFHQEWATNQDSWPVKTIYSYCCILAVHQESNQLAGATK
jgi:hypothetical protein